MNTVCLLVCGFVFGIGLSRLWASAQERQTGALRAWNDEVAFLKRRIAELERQLEAEVPEEPLELVIQDWQGDQRRIRFDGEGGWRNAGVDDEEEIP